MMDCLFDRRIASLIWGLCLGWMTGCGGRETASVVVYASQDVEYAEPIFRLFTERTGVRVLPVYDSESVKGVGLVNRLLAEANHPVADVFWNNEELRTRQLESRGVLSESRPWVAIGQRSRRWVFHSTLLPPQAVPSRVFDLTNAVYRGRIALAYPLFGSTATHFMVLRQRFGEVAWRAWCMQLQANQPLLLEGNSMVVRAVARGQAWLGLTDSDDIEAGLREGWTIVGRDLEAEDAWSMPNTAAILRAAPHPDQARQFVDFLGSMEVRQRLVQAHALESTEFRARSVAPPDWQKLLTELPLATDMLQQVFLR